MATESLAYRVKRRWTQREWIARLKRDDIHEQQLLDRVLAPDSVCVDVGANEGEFLEYFVGRAPNGLHVALEPLPDLADALRARFPHAQVHQAAAAAERGTATFYRAEDDPAWSGLAKQDYPSDTKVVELEVPLVPIDDLVEPESVSFVKIDVEGAELGALQGMRETLEARKATVLFEHAAIHAQHFDTTHQDVYDLISDAGYEISGLDGRGPWRRHGFIAECERSAASNYDRTATTNWVATPRLF